jgi:hypothetical protein
VVGGDKQFLCEHAAGSRICSTGRQQYGDIVFVAFRVHFGSTKDLRLE